MPLASDKGRKPRRPVAGPASSIKAAARPGRQLSPCTAVRQLGTPISVLQSKYTRYTTCILSIQVTLQPAQAVYGPQVYKVYKQVYKVYNPVYKVYKRYTRRLEPVSDRFNRYTRYTSRYTRYTTQYTRYTSGIHAV